MRNIFRSLLVAGLLSVAAHAATYNVVTGFTATGSNAPFSYGYGTVTPTGASNAYTASGTNFLGYPLDYRSAGSNATPTQPLVGYNSSGLMQGSINLPGNELLLHPGNTTGSDSIVLFTAPVNGVYTGSFSFTRRDTSDGSGDGVAVGVYRNGSLLFGSTLGTTYGLSFGMSGPLVLNAGDVIAFDVANNGNYNNDSTGFAASITSPTPEPSSLALLGTGVLGMAGFARRKFARS